MTSMVERANQKPVAWRCKDHADGWIYYRLEDQAHRYAESTGCVMQGLYPGPDMIVLPDASLLPPQSEE